MTTNKTSSAKSEARHWLLKLSSGESGATDQMAFRAWLESSEENQRAFDRAQQLWGELDLVSDQVLARHGDIPARPSRKTWAVAASFLVTALFAGLLWQWQMNNPGGQPSDTPTVYSSGIGELRSIELADGSVIELGAYSRLKVAYDAASRQMTLERGEAHFEVAPDPNRPFVVLAQGGSTTAIGTAFTVHNGLKRVTVTVAEGVVAVSGSATDPGWGNERVVAGSRVAYSTDGKLSPQALVSTEQVASWLLGQREFHNAPLAQLVDDLNRYSDKTVIVADARLKNIEVSGIFEDFSDTRAVLRAVEQSLPARVEERSSTIHLFHQ